MNFRKISAAVVVCALLLASTVLFSQASRGPSTEQERQQALQYIQNFQADPLGPQATEQYTWVLKWVVQVPDIHVHICMMLFELPTGNKKDSLTILESMVMAQAAFAINNRDKESDLTAEFEAGVEGALHVYETLLKANPKDRQENLDALIQQRDAGTLAQYVKERATKECKN